MNENRRKTRVAVIFGGRSGEHEVSLESASSVMAALDPDKYEVFPVGITKRGHWLTSGNSMELLKSGSDEDAYLNEIESGRNGQREAMSMTRGEQSSRELVKVIGRESFPQVDVVFPVLHGPYGEDGSLQGLFELADMAYVGAGVASSAVGMDKVLMKAVFSAAGLPIVNWLHFLRRDWQTRPEELIAEVEKELGYPCFTKPANLGSSVGICKCHDRDGLRKGLDEAARYDRKLIVEWAVPEAREIECSVLGNDDPIASVLGEVIPCNEFYDYRAKYIDGDSELIIPADIPQDLSGKIRDMAVRAFKAIDCAGMARADFLLAGGNGPVYLNELNTIPGFTSISMYPKLWAATGLSYPELLDRLIGLALERHEDKSRSETSFSVES